MSRGEDGAARRAAQTDFAAPLVVEAGAGTGKTTTLVARVLAWSLGPGWERWRAALRDAAGGEPPARDIAARVLSRVVAITFTEAAAAEMAGRLAAEVGRLAERAGAAPSWLETEGLPAGPERARRARALLGALDRLAVRTIHAFCRSLLAAHPLEAGLHPELTVDADGRALAQVAREVVEARLARGYGEPGDPHLLALAGAGHGPQEIVEALIELARAGLPAAALAEDPLGPAKVGALHRRLGRAVAGLHELIGHRLDGARRTTNAAALARGLATLAARLWGPTAAPPDLAALRAWVDEALPPKLVDHLKLWRAGRLNQTEARALAGDEAELAERAAALQGLVEHLRRLDPELLVHGFRALAPLAAELERELVTRGIATFEALLVGAAALLARHPGVRSRVRRGIDQLLVDEFQDTDRLQCELLALLALDGPAEERPGLFLVGDPKQSIYGWRSADLAAYDGFVARMVAAGGRVVALTESFRSAPPILAEVARVIAPVMREERGRQPAFARLVPSREGEPGFVRGGPRPARPVEHWISWMGDEGSRPGLGRTRAADAAELEAVAIARDLAHLHAHQGVPYGSAAILLRSTGRLDTYLDALRRAGIPFLVGRDTQYYRRREVIEAAALVRAVLDPGDHLALLTVLRSSLVGVPDTALVPLWRRGFPRLVTDLAAPRRERLERIRAAIDEAAAEVFGGAVIPGLEHLRGWAGSLLAAVEHLGLLRASFEGERAGIFLERLRRLFLPEAIEAARYLGPYRLANLERFFRQLGAALEEGGDANAVLRLLRVSVAEARDAEEGRPREGVEDAVSVLTIHGAKGLEFDHVYLAQLHAGSRPQERPAVEAGRLASPENPEVTGFEVRLFGAPSLGFDLLEAERAAVEAAERVRTLYVAMTRACERLVLLGTWPEQAAPRPAAPARTHMELLLSRPDRPREPLAELWREAVERGVWAIEDPADPGGVLWKLPALEPGPEEPPATGDAAIRLPEPGEVKRATDELGRRSAMARARMARPWSAAASEEAHERLRQAMAEQALEEKGGAAGLPSRDAALAAGGAVHRALETWDLAAEPAAELGRQRRLLPGYLAALSHGDPEPAALARAAALLDRFAAGPLLGRLAALRQHVLARELHVLLLPPDLDGEDAGGGTGAVGVVSGAIDLLYRDPASGEVVVADYKTDEVAGTDLDARVTVYGAQGKVYARAVREALGLPHPPRFELWFLAADRVVEVAID